ncbi:MAG: DUF1990 domain-containing protein [Ilumatobacteraceae bacterium]
MLTLHRPSPTALAEMVERHRETPLSYRPGLLARVGSERRWFVDRHREVVGHGPADFEAACDALRTWAKFRQPWTMPALPLASIRTGETVGYSARVLGVWWSYCCRIVTTIDETTSDGQQRFGLDYGTVRGHAERGEERFLVTLDADGAVTFELFAMSRPGRWFTWCGLPLARMAQAKFRPGAATAVRDVVTRATVAV